MTSWVIVDKKTGKGLCETFSKKNADNFAKHPDVKVVPILEWLVSLNQKSSLTD